MSDDYILAAIWATDSAQRHVDGEDNADECEAAGSASSGAVSDAYEMRRNKATELAMASADAAYSVVYPQDSVNTKRALTRAYKWFDHYKEQP